MNIADALSSCPNLQILDLTENPICRYPHYRLILASLINTLVLLDNIEVDKEVEVEGNGEVISVMIYESMKVKNCINIDSNKETN